MIDLSLSFRMPLSVFCLQKISSSDPSTLTIGGGTFMNNTALELGGAIYAWGRLSNVHITGGVFSNNTAT